jgi:hypothetical protein
VVYSCVPSPGIKKRHILSFSWISAKRPCLEAVAISDPSERARRADVRTDLSNISDVNPDKDYRFLNKNTKRECGAILLSATIILIDL